MRISDWSSDVCSSDLLLSSFACAVPGIMATRAIPDPKDRLTTILIAPLMTCSARLPVYTLIIGVFIPNRAVGGSPVGLQEIGRAPCRARVCLYVLVQEVAVSIKKKKKKKYNK